MLCINMVLLQNVNAGMQNVDAVVVGVYVAAVYVDAVYVDAVYVDAVCA